MALIPGTRLGPHAVAATEALRAGAAGLAAIGLFTEPGSCARFDGLRRIVAEIRRSDADTHVQRD